MTVVTLMVAGGASAAVVEVVRRVGARALLDEPNERSSHTRPTPRGGGLGIIIPALTAWLISDGRGEAAVVIAIGTVCVAAVSWFDDRRGVPFAVRLLVHLGAGVLTLWAVGPFERVVLPIIGTVSLGWLAWPLTLVWIVGLVNAYNFMDGIDGIAGGQGLVAGLAWGLIGWRVGAPAVSALGSLVAVTCLAFLLFNWSPARIFLGDVGSAPLGFLFAAAPLLAAHLRADQASVLAVAGVAAVWPFVFDASFTFLARLRRRENVFAAHRSHLYQRMVIAGWGHGRTALLYCGLAAACAMAGLDVVERGGWTPTAITAAGLTPLILLALARRLERR